MVFLRLFGPLGIDFTILREAAFMWTHNADPYVALLTSPGPFNYPPSAVLFLAWLGWLSPALAGMVWNLISLAAFLAALWLVFKLTDKQVVWWHYLLAVFLFTLPFFPEKFNLGNGQINNFIFFFSILSLWLYQGKKFWLAALILAYAVGIKLTPIMFLFLFVIKHDWKQLGRTLSGIATVLILPVLFLGPNSYLKYYGRIIFLGLVSTGKAVYYNQSLSGLLSRSLPSGGQEIYYWLALIFLVTTYLALRRAPLALVAAALTSLYLMLHPLAWQHHFVFAALPLIVLWRHQPHWSLGLAYALLAGNLTHPEIFAIGNPILSHQFWGNFWLWLWAIKSSIGLRRFSATT